MLLCLDRLMQTVGITAARHDTSGKLIDDQDLIILNHIILIPEHQVVGAQSQDDIVLDLQILRIRQVVDLEKLLHLLDALLRQGDDLVLFIDNEIAGLLLSIPMMASILDSSLLASPAFHLAARISQVS